MACEHCMNGATHFLCDNCESTKLLCQQHIVKRADTQFDECSHKRLSYTIRYVQLCDDCFVDANRGPATGQTTSGDQLDAMGDVIALEEEEDDR